MGGYSGGLFSGNRSRAGTGTGPFFGELTHLVAHTWAENTDLSPYFPPFPPQPSYRTTSVPARKRRHCGRIDTPTGLQRAPGDWAVLFGTEVGDLFLAVVGVPYRRPREANSEAEVFPAIFGTSLDQLFFAEKLPGPTYGTGGIMWASLKLALLTLLVVIVAIEEALATVPRSTRERPFACGASKWQTIRRIDGEPIVRFAVCRTAHLACDVSRSTSSDMPLATSVADSVAFGRRDAQPTA